MATRGRKAANGASEDPAPAESASSSIAGLLATPTAGVERDEVKVNNASVTDMKHACDDALKRVRTVYSSLPRSTLEHLVARARVRSPRGTYTRT